MIDRVGRPASAFGSAALLIAATFAAAGCVSSSREKPDLEELQEAVDAYNHAFRWKAYQQAAMALPVELRGPFIAAYEDEESSLQIEEYRLLNVSVTSARAAQVTVRVRYLMLPSVVVQRATLIQHWHKIGDRWILEAEDNSIRALDPTRQPDLPAVPEPPPEALGDTELDVFAPGTSPDDEPDLPDDPS